MCPACMATVAVIVAGVTSTGGLTVVIAMKIDAKNGEMNSRVKSKGKVA